MTKETITAFKGFDADFSCRGFQYAVGETYHHEGEIEICGAGFHACENPFDVWCYYGPVDCRYAEVELSGASDRQDGGDSKVCGASITITAEISAGDFVKRCVDWIIAATRGKGDALSSYGAKIGSSGDRAHIGSSGDWARIDSTGEKAVIASAGKNNTAKGKSGAWISLAEYDAKGECVGFATGRVGRDGIKPDTWYRAKGGKLVEVKE